MQCPEKYSTFLRAFSDNLAYKLIFSDNLAYKLIFLDNLAYKLIFSDNLGIECPLIIPSL